MEPMLLKYVEKKQKFQLTGLRRYIRDAKETVSKKMSIALKRFPITSEKRLNSLGTNS